MQGPVCDTNSCAFGNSWPRTSGRINTALSVDLSFVWLKYVETVPKHQPKELLNDTIRALTISYVLHFAFWGSLMHYTNGAACARWIRRHLVMDFLLLRLKFVSVYGKLIVASFAIVTVIELLFQQRLAFGAFDTLQNFPITA